MARIVQLAYYPVKGCAAVTASDALVTSAGLAHDRSFMAVDVDGGFRTQRRYPRLATIRPEIGEDGARLVLRAPGVEPCELAVDLDGPRGAVELFGVPYRGIDQGAAVAEWLTEVLGVPSRLVRVPPEHRRVTGGRTPGLAGFADSGAISVTTLSSVDELNRRIVANGGDAVPVNRFRMNLVLDDLGEPHAEDRLRTYRVGEAEFGYAKLDIRCVVVTVDQEAGVKTGPEPLRTLADYRRASSGGVAFGAKAAVVRPGKLSVGDELIVTEWGESELVE